MGIIFLLLSCILCFYSNSSPVLMFDEDPGSEDFVLTRKVNLHENQRHREDILDQLVGWIRDGRERDYQIFKRNPTPGYRRKGNVRYHRCYHNPVACF